MPGPLAVDILRAPDAIAALRPEWEALERLTPEATGFQAFAWCQAWLATGREVAPRRIEARVVTVRQDGRLVMLLPLQVERLWGLRLVRWIGEPLTQYGDALAVPGADRARWRAAAEAAMRRWRDVDLVMLSRLRADGVLQPLAGGRPASDDDHAPFIDLCGVPPAALPIVANRGSRRRERRLVALGAVSLERVADPAAAVSAVDLALSLKRAWLRARRLYSTGLSHPFAGAFLARLASEGQLTVGVLRVGAAAAAVEFGFVCGTTYRSLLSAYDLRFADGSPGHALTRRLVEEGAGAGWTRFDLLAPSDAYKARWASGQVAIGRQTIVLSLRGWLGAFALAKLRPLAKRALRLLANRLQEARPRQAWGDGAEAASGKAAVAPV